MWRRTFIVNRQFAGWNLQHKFFIVYIYMYWKGRSFCIGYRMQNLDIHLSTKETNSDILRDIEYK